MGGRGISSSGGISRRAWTALGEVRNEERSFAQNKHFLAPVCDVVPPWSVNCQLSPHVTMHRASDMNSKVRERLIVMEAAGGRGGPSLPLLLAASRYMSMASCLDFLSSSM